MTDENQQLSEFDQTVVAKVQQELPKAIEEIIQFRGELTLVIDRGVLVDVCSFIQTDTELAMNFLCDLCAVDMYPEHPRFEINVQLLSVARNPQPGQGTRRLRLKVRLEEEDATMPSLTGLWPGSAWYERETHELYGIGFEGHPDLRPLLLPDDWEGTPPMRRDVPVLVEEVAFSFNHERIYRNKPFAKE